MLRLFLRYEHYCACMVHIKFTARTRTPIVSSEIDSMASDEALETSAQQREASTEATSSHSAVSDRESWFGDSGDSETASECLKVVVEAGLAEITYDFGSSGITKARVMSMENYVHYFPKGYGRALGAESVPEPHVNEAVVFKDFFTVGLRMPPNLVLVDILHKF
jgi:hypothetical protein